MSAFSMFTIVIISIINLIIINEAICVDKSDLAATMS